MSQAKKRVGPAVGAAERQQKTQNHYYHHASQSRFRIDRPVDRKYSSKTSPVYMTELVFVATLKGGN